MVLPALSEKLLEEFDKLGAEDQHRVLDFARALAEAQARGTPANALLRFSGIWDTSTADQIAAAIVEGCEQVNPDEW